MVLQKRLDYGSCGYQVPTTPHVPRSARGKRSARKKSEENQMCAFDLLATVAGKLLTEGENSLCAANVTGAPNFTVTKDTVKQEQFDEVKPLKTDVLHQDSCNESYVGSDILFQRQVNHIVKENSPTPIEAVLSPASAFVDVVLDKGSKSSCMKSEFGHSFGTILDKVASGRCSPISAKFAQCKGDGAKTPPQARRQFSKTEMDGDVADVYSLVDPMDMDVKPPALVSSDSSAEEPMYRDRIPRSSSFPKYRGGMELPVDRDDDENSSGCTNPSTSSTKAFRPHCVGDRRVRKLLASKFRKVAPIKKHEGELSNNDVEMRSAFRNKKMFYTRQRTQRNTFKRRKLFEHRLISPSDEEIFGQGMHKSAAKGTIKVEAGDLHATSLGASRVTFSPRCQKPLCDSEDYHVKLNIKSFKVPELFIEIPETATVGSLKRTVMEAVTAIIGGGLHVGVLLQGKKVKDDNKTLRQAGIAYGNKLDSLGFTLEPNFAEAPAQLVVPEDSHFLDSGDVTEPLARIPPVEPPADHVASDVSRQPVLTSQANSPESDHDSVYSPTDVSLLDKTSANSQAIVPLPAMNPDALAVVPLRKSRQSEIVQRRIRRPFSVAEVEALVQAVEKLGTGRWRDVKLRAFDNAKHRTYVDLKDKWKTLVHTASISPQQRRGEPVPQELLDRVLATQAYWSQQQAKLQAKPPVAETCLLL
ncbi:telomere-binding protein 1-like isoform X1 [Typha latifolia]|uniref:telomere-binding protein 1-like isoform X1 n=1 Tax=Typha latifolia TaxID=4733 RepID=UPI003C2C98B6